MVFLPKQALPILLCAASALLVTDASVLSAAPPADAFWRSTHAAAFAGPSDGDGILWRNLSTGAQVIWLMNGTSITTATEIYSGGGWQAVQVADFDGDGKADLLWRDASTNTWTMWLMNGTGMVAHATLLDGGTDWQVSTCADFNADGKADLLWRNTATGALAIWFMNGTSVAGGGTLLGGGTDWAVAAICDFNGDNTADVLWHNTATTAHAIWLMNGLSVIGGGTLMESTGNWTILSTADFNGDNMDDVLWRNTATGTVSLWLMNGLTVAGGGTIYDGGCEWNVVFTTDFNADGRTDIVWGCASTGDYVTWLMDGASVTSSGSITSGAADWKPVLTGDFSHDRQADILWLGRRTGSTSLWLTSAGIVTATAELTQGSPDSFFRFSSASSGPGSVSASVQTDEGFLPSGSLVTLTATPVSGAVFTAWSGGATSTINPLTVTLTADLAINGAFSVINPDYNLYGFATLGTGCIGGGIVAETNTTAYKKVTTALEFANALISFNKGTGVKVIEIMNDLDLGWNEVGTAVQTLSSTPFRAGATPKLHPRLIITGVSTIDIKGSAGGLTIFSANGSTLRHATLNFKTTKNIIVRNLKFDEMWEWDEASKGDYDSNDWDFMCFSNGGAATNIWVDHCTFTKAYDGVTDMKKTTQYVTFSWCRYVGDDGATNSNSFVWQQINALEANRSSCAMYNFLRTNGFSSAEIVQVIQGHDKTHLMGATSDRNGTTNDSLSATFHHLWFQNCWDRVVPRLRGGQVHNYNLFVDDAVALVAKRLRDTRKAAMTTTNQNTLENTYSFNPFLNGTISTEHASILVEKSIYMDCLTPLRNNQTDVTDPTYTGKVKAADTVYIFHNTDGTTTTVRGDSTDAGNPLGPIQAPVIAFAWNTTEWNTTFPYTRTMDDPSSLPAILQAGSGAGVVNWARENWLKTSY